MGSSRQTLTGLMANLELQPVSSSGDLAREVQQVIVWEAGNQINLSGALVILTWSAQHGGGPLTDLSATLRQIAKQDPAAVLVCPDRQVNAPPVYLALAGQYRLTLLWETAGRNSVQLEKLIVSQLGPPLHSERSKDHVSLVLNSVRETSSADALIEAIERVFDAQASLHSFEGAGHPLVQDIPDPAELRRENFAVELTLTRGPDVLGRCVVRRHYPFTFAERADLESLGVVLSLALRVSQLEDDPGTLSRTLLRRILGEDLHMREASLRKSRRLTIFPDFEVIFLALEPFGIATTIDGMRKLASAIAPIAMKFDTAAIVLLHEGVVTVVTKSSQDLEALSRAICRSAQIPLVIGASEPTRGARRYASAFRQAQRAISVARRIQAVNRLTAFEKLGVLGIFYQMPEHVRQDFVKRTLGPLAENSKTAAEYRSIMQTMHQCAGNVSEAAKQLYVHPNTLRQRITRIEALIGDFQHDADLRLSIYTALSMYRLDNEPEG